MTIRNRTAFSFRNAIGNLNANHKKVTEITGGFSVITDTASTFAHTRWTKLCKKAGSKPIFGIELAVTKSVNEKKPGFDYWTFIAQDSLRPLHELLLLATNQFRYVPLLTMEQAIRAEGVFKIAGSKSDYSELPQDIFVALSPSMNRAQYKKASELNRNFVLASDNRYIEPEDRELFQIQLGRDASVQTYPQHLMTNAELIKDLQHRGVGDENITQSLSNREFIFANSNAHQLASTLLVPEKPQTLEAMCIEGAARLGCNLNDPVYKARLYRELDLIALKEFEDYFYIIADICQWARQRMIVGPARGSSCGSLVCYLLEITTVDPIPYGLIFERFIDVNRGGWFLNPKIEKLLEGQNGA